MKKRILSAVIMLCGVAPAMGITIRNSTDKDLRLVLLSADQKNQFGTTILAPRKGASLTIPNNLSALRVSLGSLIPARKQMTIIEPYTSANGWLFIGKNAENNDIFKPLLPVSAKELIPSNAQSSYTLIDGNITRIDLLTETINEADSQQQVFQPASYERAIDPASYLLVTQPAVPSARFTMQIYDSKVAKKAVAAIKGKKIS